MAYEKQHWQDALQAAKPKGSGSNDSTDPREAKKRSRIMYNKRKLEKEIKKYVKNRIWIRSKDIDAIGRKHGFQSYGMEFESNRDGEQQISE